MNSSHILQVIVLISFVSMFEPDTKSIENQHALSAQRRLIITTNVL